VKINEIGMPEGANRKTKRRGRGSGSGHGKTSCRGHKGTGQRSGRGVRLGFEGGQMPLIRRIPKRGFTSPFKKFYQTVNVEALNRFENNTIVGLKELKEAGLIGSAIEMVKILGDGKLTKTLTVKAHKVSVTAKKKIEEAGSKIELISKVK
jgi:large subunit ribosomal protein L15